MTTVLQSTFKAALAVAGRSVAGKSTLPVLANVHLSAADGALEIRATNLETGVLTTLGAQTDMQLDEWSGTAPYKLLSDVINSLPNDRVALTWDARGNSLGIKCAKFSTNIKGIEGDEFPGLPKIDGADGYTIAGGALSAAIAHVAYAAASDDTRPSLAGVLVECKAGRITLAAADGFRLATETIEAAGASDFTLIIPARAMLDAARMMDGEECRISTNGAQVRFDTAAGVLFSRLIDGKFPDFTRIIPAQYTTRAIVDRAEVLKALKVAGYFAASAQNVVKFTVEEGRIVITANAAEVGDNTAEVDALVHGEGGQIAANVHYLTEAIGSINTAQIALEMQTASTPLVIKPVGGTETIAITMPMSLRN